MRYGRNYTIAEIAISDRPRPHLCPNLGWISAFPKPPPNARPARSRTSPHPKTPPPAPQSRVPTSPSRRSALRPTQLTSDASAPSEVADANLAPNA